MTNINTNYSTNDNTNDIALKVPFDRLVSLIPAAIQTNTPSFIKGITS